MWRLANSVRRKLYLTNNHIFIPPATRVFFILFFPSFSFCLDLTTSTLLSDFFLLYGILPMFSPDLTQHMTISGNLVEIATFPVRSVRFFKDSSVVSSLGSPDYAVASVARARRKLTRLVCANTGGFNDGFGVPIPARFVTYTPRDNVTDLKVSTTNFMNYMKRLNDSIGFTSQYIAVPEFQKRGAVHFHQFLFNFPFRNDVKTFLAERWGWGYVKFETMRSTQGSCWYAGKYMMKSFSDIKYKNRKRFFRSDNLRLPVVEKNPVKIELARLRLNSLPSGLVSYRKIESSSSWVRVYERFGLPTGWTLNNSEIVRVSSLIL
jgi:hypothetical protein